MTKPDETRPAAGSSVKGAPAGRAGAPVKTVDPGTKDPRSPDIGLGTMREADGRIRSWTVGPDGLTLVLRSEVGTVFSLSNTQPHYPSVLSTILAAAARDEKIVVAWTDLARPTTGTVPLSAVGVGTEPAFG